MSVRAFYDDLAPWYHLVYQDWESTVRRQGEALSTLIVSEWGSGVRRVLDAAVGIGTQALGLATKGYCLLGSDISAGVVRRAVGEGRRRGLRLHCMVADMRALPFDDGVMDALISCDNYFAVPPAVVAGIMQEVGFKGVRRVDGCLFQPVLVGTK